LASWVFGERNGTGPHRRRGRKVAPAAPKDAAKWTNGQPSPSGPEVEQRKTEFYVSAMRWNRLAECEFTITLPRPALQMAGSAKLIVRYRDGRLTLVRLIRGAGAMALEAPAKPANLKRDFPLERSLRTDFVAYFAGRKVEFDYPVELEGFSLFQKMVWAAMREIPYGQTRSYRWLAEKIGKPQACRAVGNACGKNPLLIIQPCHRVVGSHGNLGGFSAGLELKKALLRLEGDPPKAG